MSAYEVTVDGVTVKAAGVGEALEVAADLVEAAGQDAGVVITCYGELDPALTELAAERLKPVRLGHGWDGHLGVGAPAA